MKLTALVLALAVPFVPFAVTTRHVVPETAVTAQQGGPRVALTEWTVPWEKSRPRDPFVDAQGGVWFVGQVGNYLARLDPKTGKFTRVELEPGTNPHNLIVDRAGIVWYAGNRNGTIGRLDPATGKITRYAMPDSAARDPHTLVLDHAGDVWFTVQGGGFVGRLATRTGAIRLVKVPARGARPYGIEIDPRGRPWFVEFGRNVVATIDPATMALREYPLPDAGARPRRIAITSDGAIWYGDFTRGFLGRLDPATGRVREWALPGGARSFPYAMTRDDRDRLWLAETGVSPNRLVAFDPKSEKWVATAAITPSGGGVVRHMIFHAPTRTIWFGTDMNTIGRAAVRDEERISRR